MKSLVEKIALHKPTGEIGVKSVMIDVTMAHITPGYLVDMVHQ